MSFITDNLKPALSVDHETTILNAIENMVIEGKEAAVVRHKGQIVGILDLEVLLNQAKNDSLNISRTSVFLVMEPIIFMGSSEKKVRASKLMGDKDVEHIAVTNKDGVFIGIVSAKDLARTGS